MQSNLVAMGHIEVFELPTDFTDLLGRSCVLSQRWVNMEAWDEGCLTKINNEILSEVSLALRHHQRFVD